MNAILGGFLAHFHTLGVGMAFYLKHGGLDGGLLHNLVEHLVVGVEVADADGAYLAHLHGFLHIFPRTHEVAHGLVDIEQVDVVQLQTLEHLVNGFQRLAFAVLRRQSLLVIQISLRGMPLSFTA